VEDHLAVALTQRDRDILDFERSWWTATSPKDVQIRERFELSATRYYQLLAELLEDGVHVLRPAGGPSTPAPARSSSQGAP